MVDYSGTHSDGYGRACAAAVKPHFHRSFCGLRHFAISLHPTPTLTFTPYQVSDKTMVAIRCSLDRRPTPAPPTQFRPLLRVGDGRPKADVAIVFRGQASCLSRRPHELWQMDSGLIVLTALDGQSG
ncbi:hypothetical protein CH063_00643 [Colletotrichum higginsianum]|uniref:Uncharacterized protein n=1 Tax=Colletotrichum higginsianum (strain IMI 349063) TaxID=759273 RepID=H1W2Y7_COLHI|nr:hypothetical protein CH063_00643 [Colletotrichum higginsianum]